MSNDATLTERKLIISIPEARKIMGKDAKSLSDEQIEKLITDFIPIYNFTVAEP